jgi:hypothetical protein
VDEDDVSHEAADEEEKKESGFGFLTRGLLSCTKILYIYINEVNIIVFSGVAIWLIWLSSDFSIIWLGSRRLLSLSLSLSLSSVSFSPAREGSEREG